ncbi:quinone oxidoreductase family protein [Spirosoma montaniterrae]|uniref:NADPH:quinone reductase n=1 Tax=Spirosoma montaniterrae TaxID=1178516 RepID=A0A1P9WS65_9BACT|nr:quinone oxidoreductase [Spirosoma montaniterrae]AQG78190.1 NADPH:quinone reductase [Spirosoma montaniterrae]
MKAIQFTQTGGPDVLALVDLPTPTPKAGEALVRHTAIGINYIDTYHRSGLYPVPLPYVPGNEGAGVVEAVGEGVTVVKPGQRVGYTTHPGSYAEYNTVPADRLVPIPDGLTDQQAAAALLQGMTAQYLAYTTYPIRPGDTVLIHAGAGGVGLLLTQIARQRGARVITTVSTEEKAQLSRQHGADEVILYTQTDFADEIRRLTGGQGVHVVYDSVGQSTFEGSLNSLRPLGAMVSFGNASGAVPPFAPAMLSAKGSLMLTRPKLNDYILTRQALLERAGMVFNWVASGELSLLIQPPYALADAAQAHRDLEGRGTTGKLLLLP